MMSLIYVSHRNGRPDGRMLDVDDIVTVSRPRNAALEVTGALIATPTHFAQMLEGPAVSLVELMTSIGQDRRHRIASFIELDPKPRRDFDGWSLAYHGDSNYVAAMLADTIAASDFELAAHADQIRTLMQMFA